MPKPPKTLNALVGDVIRGRFTTAGVTIEQLSERTGIAYGTLRKKIAGTSPIFVTELIAISRALDNEEDSPASIIDESQRRWARMSEARPDNVTAFPDRTAEQYEGPMAAHPFDPEATEPDTD